MVDIEYTRERADRYYWPVCEPSVDSLAECIEFCTENVNFVATSKVNARMHAEKHMNWFKNSEVVIEVLHNARNRRAPVALINEIARHEGRLAERLYGVVLSSPGASHMFEKLITLGRRLK